MMSEEGYEEDWNETEKWNETWNTATGPMIKTWNDGYWANEDLYNMDEYRYFQKKGKGKGKQGKKSKDDEGKGGKPGDGKGKPNSVQPQASSAPSHQQQQHHQQQQQEAHYS